MTKAALTILFAMTAVLLVCSGPSQSQSLGVSSVTGHAYVTLGDGSSNVLRGHELTIVPFAIISGKGYRDILSRFSELRTECLNEVNAILQLNPAAALTDKGLYDLSYHNGLSLFYLGYVPRLIDQFHLLMTQAGSRKARTNFEGKYTVSGLEKGDYVVYSRYKTNFDDSFWVVAFSADGSDTSEIDLSNFNMEPSLCPLEAIKSVNDGLGDIISRLGSAERIAYLESSVMATSKVRALPLPSIFTQPLVPDSDSTVVRP